MNYQEYLESPEWRTLRRQRLVMDNGECVLCGATAQEIHHRRYPENYGDETVDDLVSLCHECHSNFHGTGCFNLRIPKPEPPTPEMLILKETMRQAEKNGESELSLKTLSRYVMLRRAQVMG